MARKVEFSLNGKTIFAEIKKVDRKKIYGWSVKDVYDKDGGKCQLAGLADGKYVMPSGSTSLLTVDSHGQSVSRSSLIGVDNNGDKVAIVPSVFDKKVDLKLSTIDDYLSLSVKSVYQLYFDKDMHGQHLLNELNKGKVYYFLFNYRADYEGDDAFLISNDDHIFAITGMCSELDFIGLENNINDLDIQEHEEDEDLDFAMF